MTNVMLNGGQYKKDTIIRMSLPEVRERLENLLTVTDEMIASSDKLQSTRLKTLTLSAQLKQQINELEEIVDKTENDLVSLNKNCKSQHGCRYSEY